VTVEKQLPRFVIGKTVGAETRFYWTLPTYYRKLGCLIHKQNDTALGTNYDQACIRAGTLNALFDEWDRARLGEEPIAAISGKPGTVDWLFRIYKGSLDWKERVSERTAPDHELTIHTLCNARGKSGIRIGDRMIAAISPNAADKLYEKVRTTPVRKGKTERPRTAEKVVAIARHAWKVVHRLHPEFFRKEVPNPWEGVAMKHRHKAAKAAVTRDDVYAFAWGAVNKGFPGAAAAAVICFEWLQRPENVLAGYVSWADYRGKKSPDTIRIEHHKTGAMVLHPLEETASDAEGNAVRTLFYEEAEDVLAKVPKLGHGIVMRESPAGPVKWDPFSMGRLVRGLREELGLPETFTLDACRHGGMTELEEAELTDGQGRALSAHRSKAYEGYAKRTAKRALAATRKRHAYRITVAADASSNSETAKKPGKTGHNLPAKSGHFQK
jgi:hypothetical protein